MLIHIICICAYTANQTLTFKQELSQYTKSGITSEMFTYCTTFTDVKDKPGHKIHQTNAIATSMKQTEF